MSPKELLTILLRRFWITIVFFASVLISAGAMLFVVPPIYEAQATASVDVTSSDPVTGQSVSAIASGFLQGNLALLARSNRVALEAVRRLGLTGNPQMMAQYYGSGAAGRVEAAEWIAGELARGIGVRFNSGSNVLTISYRSSNPQLAAQVANVFLASFADAAIASQVAGANQTAQWLEPQMQRLLAEAEQARIAANRFQMSQRLAPNNATDTDMTALNAITRALGTAQSELLTIRTAIDLMNEGKADSLLDSFDTPLLQSLKANLSQTIADVSRQQSIVGANNSRLLALEASRQSIEAQIEKERDEIRRMLENKREILEAQVVVFEKARSEQLAAVIAIQEQRDQLATLQRDWKSKQESYVQASTAASAARLRGQLSFSNISTLDTAATPVTPAFPRPMAVIPSAIVAGLGLGLILALIAEALDRRIRGPRDLEFAVMAPQLGTMVSAPVGRGFGLVRWAGTPGRGRNG